MAMQKIATHIFIWASLVFGVLGIVLVLVAVNNANANSTFDQWLLKGFMISIFVILPSFALSVAGKYLDGKK